MSDMALVKIGDSTAHSDSISLRLKKQYEPSTSQLTLLSLPLELRWLIYEEVIGTKINKWASLNSLLCPTLAKGLNLLGVCKQINAEIAPFIYKEAAISCDIDCWIQIFQRIGVPNFERIENFSFSFGCLDHGYTCYGPHSVIRKSGQGEAYHRDWDRLFAYLGKREISPKRISITFEACEDVKDWRRRRARPAPEHSFSTCHVYRDLRFLKHLWACLGRAEEILLCGVVNPLVGLALRKRYGFIIKREYHHPKWVGRKQCDPRWVLISPQHLEARKDLKGYAESRTHKGIYDKEGEEVYWARGTW
ncbi:hypothetical protein GGS26DRAFT_599168 [Hypomontagnella submonticulosa]|nr:hypothetical protein GGS26DRAFT_599168 [Hypomontagnella submonticulosa]